MTDTLEDQQFSALTAKISQDRGFGCASYKDKCLKRRIAVRMRARGVHTYSDYADILDTDPTEYDRLLDALTINVTKLFRNWEVYEAIARVVIPALWARDSSPIRVWSAGCSSGEEPYSLAVLFHRHAASGNDLGRLARVNIHGTDIDRESLASAARGHFVEASFSDTPPDLRKEYFTEQPPFTVSPVVRSLITLEQRDLLREGPPATGLDLVICRNVLIYFDRHSQERLLQMFHAALRPGGFLVLGKVETLLGESRARFAGVDARQRIFQKL